MSNFKLLGVRVKQSLHEEFNNKSEEFKMTPSEVIRELVEAFLEDRLTIRKKERPIDKLYEKE